MALRGNFSILFESYPSDQKKRKEIIEVLTRKILDSGIELSILDEDLYLLLDEAITNSMEHGNRWDPDKKIIVAVNAYPDSVRVSITDEGKGFNTAKMRPISKKRGSSQSGSSGSGIQSLRGRGIRIINQFCKTTWNKKGNRINLTIERKDE